MGLRPASCYRNLAKSAYTRTAVSKPRKAYIKGVPGVAMHFHDGNVKGKYGYIANLIAKETGQIRSNALEAVRVTITKHCVDTLGENGYYLQFRVYPHHVLRENAMVSGAGADRVQTGMRQSFGRNIGKAARVKAGQTILEVFFNDKSDEVRQILTTVPSKLPVPCTVEIQKISAQ